MSDQDGTFKTQTSDDITSLTHCSKEEVGALEEVLHRRRPDENTPHTPSYCSLQEESLRVRGSSVQSE